MSGEVMSRRAALAVAGMASTIGLSVTPPAPKFHELTDTEYQRLTDLLLRRIAGNLGIASEMDAEFGKLDPRPGDDRLLAASDAFARRTGWK